MSINLTATGAGIAFSAGAAVFFGTLSIFAKLAYRAGAEPLPLLGLRFTVAAILLAAFHMASRRRMMVDRRSLIRLLALGAFGYGVESTLFFMALEHASAAVVGLVFYSYPLWTTLGAIAAGLDRPRLAVFVALALSSAGVLLIFSLPEGSLLGPLLALASALAVTLYFLVAQLLLREVQPSAAAMWTSVGAALATGGVSAATGRTLPLDAVWPAIALGTVTAIAFLLMYEGIERIGSSRFAIAAMLEPVTTIVLAAAVLSESITLRVVAGGVLVVSALPILAASKRDEPVPAADTL